VIYLAFLTSAFSLSSSPHETRQLISAMQVYNKSIMQQQFFLKKFTRYPIALLHEKLQASYKKSLQITNTILVTLTNSKPYLWCRILPEDIFGQYHASRLSII
jgi:hypothetical protein